MSISSKAQSKTQELIEKDQKFLWHPFTQMQEWCAEDPLVIERGEGVYLFDTEGRRYIDGVSSLWCNVHGHQRKEIDDAVRDQLEKIAHSTFLGLTHEPGILLAEKLIQIAPKGLARVFYSDSGSEAMEIALKIAFQYWQQKSEKKRKKFVKLGEAYHGDTVGSVSVGGIDLFHEVYGPMLFETFKVPTPFCYFCHQKLHANQCVEKTLEALENILKTHGSEICAVVMEPLVQGAAGMLVQPPGYISRVRALTLRYNTLLILDEVATGFGRTGKMFASEHENVTPDIMAVAKGLTGGYLPLAATLTTEEIYGAFLGKFEEFKQFFHGHTFTGNQLASRAALASLEIFEKENFFPRVILAKAGIQLDPRLRGGDSEGTLQPKIRLLERELEKFYEIPTVGDIRQCGMMVGIELVKDRKTRTPFPVEERISKKVILKARELGAILRPLGDTIILMPPLAISMETLGELISITHRAIKAYA